MSIQTELTRITNAKAAIKTAIEGKGVTVPEATLLDGMAALIEAIQAGGGDVGGRDFEYLTYTLAEDKTTTFYINTEKTFGPKERNLVVYWTTPINTDISSDPAHINYGMSGVSYSGNKWYSTVNAVVDKYGSFGVNTTQSVYINGNTIGFQADTTMVAPAGKTIHILVIDISNDWEVQA